MPVLSNVKKLEEGKRGRGGGREEEGRREGRRGGRGKAEKGDAGGRRKGEWRKDREKSEYKSIALLHCITWCYIVLHGVTLCYMVLHCVILQISRSHSLFLIFSDSRCPTQTAMWCEGVLYRGGRRWEWGDTRTYLHTHMYTSATIHWNWVWE